MDSINKNQQEHNQQDLSADEARKRIMDMISKTRSCFFCTANSIGDSMGVRPMSVLKVDEEGVLWFLSAVDSYKNREIEADNRVKLYFQGSAHADFLYLYGDAIISKDKVKIEELWEPVIKTWFTEGKNDPRITVIQVTPTDGYYWDTKNGKLIAGIKMLAGALTGRTMDDSIEGKISI